MAQEQQAPNGAQQQIQLKISDEVMQGVYSNMAQISHTQEEFFLDFMNIFFGQQPPTGSIASRVIISPAHMKRLVGAMQENIKRYETQFGEIPDNTGPQNSNFGFRTE